MNDTLQLYSRIKLSAGAQNTYFSFGAQITGAQFTGAQFTGAQITGAQITVYIFLDGGKDFFIISLFAIKGWNPSHPQTPHKTPT